MMTSNLLTMKSEDCDVIILHHKLCFYILSLKTFQTTNIIEEMRGERVDMQIFRFHTIRDKFYTRLNGQTR